MIQILSKFYLSFLPNCHFIFLPNYHFSKNTKISFFQSLPKCYFSKLAYQNVIFIYFIFQFLFLVSCFVISKLSLSNQHYQKSAHHPAGGGGDFLFFIIMQKQDFQKHKYQYFHFNEIYIMMMFLDRNPDLVHAF